MRGYFAGVLGAAAYLGVFVLAGDLMLAYSSMGPRQAIVAVGTPLLLAGIPSYIWWRLTE